MSSSIGQNNRSLISKKLDEIVFSINHVLECMNHDGGSRTGLQTLRMSLVKAHQLASDKSSMIDPDHETKRTDIEAWLMNNQPNEYAGTESAPSVCLCIILELIVRFPEVLYHCNLGPQIVRCQPLQQPDQQLTTMWLS